MPRDALLDKVLAYAAEHGIADKSLREIATGVGTSHRMLLYHFGSREGLLAALVGTVEEQQRAVLTALATGPDDDGAVMLRLWEQVSQPELRPFVRLFFATVGLAVQGVPGTEGFLENLTAPWLDRGGEAQRHLGLPVDRAALRLGVAVSRGLLLDLVAGTELADVDASYRLFVQMWQRFAPR
jgi:AcrR family transcriptional regulator